MKVSSRIILGFAVLLLVSIAALSYQVVIIYRVQAINQNLAEININAKATILHVQGRTLFDLADFAEKYFVRKGDPDYLDLVNEVRQDLARELTQLSSKARTAKTKDAIAQLAKETEDFWTLFEKERARIDPEAEGAIMPHPLNDAIDDLRSQAGFVSTAVDASIQEELNRAAIDGNRAKTVSMVAGAASILIAILLALLIARAISDPLRQLTQGTRRIAKGQFWHRLPDDGPPEFAELARDFNSMAQRLSELDEMKKGFVSHVSHELKAPLASMRQVFHLMLQEIPGPMNDQQRKLLRLSSNSAERLAAMVGNLLDVSRMEAGTMEYDIHPHEMVALVRSVAEEFDVQAQEKGIGLSVVAEGEALAECDRDRIVQVVGNLFENALKFAPEGSSIVAGVQREGRQVRISVTDSGPGVPEEHKKKIFEKFHQVKKGKKINGQGVGLGLAICRTIVEAHNGELWVEDNPSGGSVFCFVLHAARTNRDETPILINSSRSDQQLS